MRSRIWMLVKCTYQLTLTEKHEFKNNSALIVFAWDRFYINFRNYSFKKSHFWTGLLLCSFRSTLGKLLSFTEKNNNATVNIPDWVKSDLTYRYLKKLYLHMITFFSKLFFMCLHKIRYIEKVVFPLLLNLNPFFPFPGCRHIKSYSVVRNAQKKLSRPRCLV